MMYRCRPVDLTRTPMTAIGRKAIQTQKQAEDLAVELLSKVSGLSTLQLNSPPNNHSNLKTVSLSHILYYTFQKDTASQSIRVTLTPKELAQSHPGVEILMTPTSTTLIVPPDHMEDGAFEITTPALVQQARLIGEQTLREAILAGHNATQVLNPSAMFAFQKLQ